MFDNASVKSSSKAQPLITVAICTYNAERYLRETLDSVFHQTYENIEIVVVDDGSTDGTRTILEEAKALDNRVKVFNERHEGLATSRTKSFKYASGEWIAIIDADDLCYPNRIEIQLETSYKYPNADLIFCDTDYIDERGGKLGRHLSQFKLPPFIPKGMAGNQLLRYGCFVDSEAFFARKRAIDSLGPLDCNLKYATDYDFFIRLGLVSSFANDPRVLGAWRIHPTQMTSYYSGIVAKENIYVYSKYLLYKGVTNWTRVLLFLKIVKNWVRRLALKFRRIN